MSRSDSEDWYVFKIPEDTTGDTLLVYRFLSASAGRGVTVRIFDRNERPYKSDTMFSTNQTFVIEAEPGATFYVQVSFYSDPVQVDYELLVREKL